MCDGLTLGEFRDNLSVLLSWNTKTTNHYICFKLNRGDHAKKQPTPSQYPKAGRCSAEEGVGGRCP